jgi:hypothetical protein
MRVWKQWLQDRALELWQHEQDPDYAIDDTPSSSYPIIGVHKNILWTDYRKNVGLRVAIRDREGTCYGKDVSEYDDLPMSFSIEIQGEVGFSRTVHVD